MRGPTSIQLKETQDLRDLEPQRLAALCRAWLGCHSDLVLLLSSAGRITHVGGNGGEVVSRLSGAAWSSIWPKDHRREALAALAEAKAGRTARFQGAFPSAAGEPSWWDVAVAPVVNDDADRVELLVLLRDITAFKREDERQAQSRRLEAIGRLTGGIAHDFNNLLTVILSASECLAEDAEDEAAQQLAQVSVDAAERGAELIRRLLAFSRPSACGDAVADGAGAIECVTKLLRQTLPERIQFEAEAPAGLLYCRADRGELEAALLNLCLNARDAMPAGGRLALKAAVETLDPARAAQLGLRAQSYAVFSVEDAGVGMSAETAARAIEPFFSTKTAHGGTGLGLSSAHGFARGAGGTLHIRSRLGRGTRIDLYLPLARTAGQPELPLTLGRAPKTDCAVLLVEDDAAVRTQTARLLKAMGCRVTAVEDAQGAIETLIGETPLDLMITDMRLPYGLGGAELAEAATALRPQIRVLFTSGYLEEFAHSPGGNFIAKPFGRAALTAALHDSLAREDDAHPAPAHRPSSSVKQSRP